MNLLIGFVIIVCLFLSETGARQQVDDPATRLTIMMLITLSVPALALLQTLFATRFWNIGSLPHDRQEAMLKRLSTCHSAVWLVASLMVISSTGWHTIVRENWNLANVPLIDELLIILPMLFSLVASWAVFYELQREISTVANRRDVSKNESRSRLSILGERLRFRLADRRRLTFVGIRVRVYLLMALVPVIVFVLLRDLSNPEVFSWPVTSAALVLTSMVVLFGFPFVLCRIWKVRKIADRKLHHRLLEYCRKERLYVRDVRIWETGGQVVNAMLVGMIPRFRIILLSDALVERFTPRELDAIVRHEAGHVRLMHLPVRVMFALLPLFVVAAIECSGYSIPRAVSSFAAGYGMNATLAPLLAPAVYGVFIVIGLGWLSRKMEFEADLFAALDSEDREAGANAIDLADALLRLANLDPDKAARRTLMHPGILSRVERIHAAIAEGRTDRGHPDRCNIRKNRLYCGVCFAAALILTIAIAGLQIRLT